jgi:hypothetical protein
MKKSTSYTPDPLRDYAQFERDDAMDKNIAYILQGCNSDDEVRDAWHNFFTLYMEFPFEAMVKEPMVEHAGNTASTVYSRTTIHKLAPLNRSSGRNMILVGVTSYHNTSFHIFTQDLREIGKHEHNRDLIILYRYWLRNYGNGGQD